MAARGRKFEKKRQKKKKRANEQTAFSLFDWAGCFAFLSGDGAQDITKYSFFFQKILQQPP